MVSFPKVLADDDLPVLLQVTRAFLGQGDSMHNSAALLPELLVDGIRFLAYSGNADFMCNFMVNRFHYTFHVLFHSPLLRV